MKRTLSKDGGELTTTFSFYTFPYSIQFFPFRYGKDESVSREDETRVREREEVECHRSAVWRCGHIFIRVHKFFDYLSPRESFHPRCAVRNVSNLVSYLFMDWNHYQSTGIFQLFEDIKRKNLWTLSKKSTAQLGQISTTAGKHTLVNKNLSPRNGILWLIFVTISYHHSPRIVYRIQKWCKDGVQ